MILSNVVSSMWTTLTFEDYVGLLPFFAFAGFIVYTLFRGVVWFCFALLRLITKKHWNAPKNEDDSVPMFQQTIVYMLMLSYLLSPLSKTMVHVRGKRWNRGLSRNGTSSGLFDLVYGTDPHLQQLMAQMPSLLRGPKPPLIFANRHLQFLPWMLQNELHRQEGLPYQRLYVPVTACADKSIPAKLCDRPPQFMDTLTLDVFPPFGKKSSLDDGAPLILISPGLRSNSEDIPGTMLIRRAYGAGFRSVIVHRRGHTPNQPLRAPRFNIFGDVDDLEQVYWYLQNSHLPRHTPMFLHGISSGTAVVVTALSQWDERRFVQGDATAPTFVGSVSIAPGYDISKAMTPKRLKAPYNAILTGAVQNHFVRANEALLRQYNNKAVDMALKATNLHQFLLAVTPFAGYPNATAYFAGENPVNNLHQITTPKLVVNSVDDPCCHVYNVYDESIRMPGRTYAQIVAESPRGLLAVTNTGSHCPFLDTGDSENVLLPSLLPAIVPDPYSEGSWMLDSWADRISLEFYQAALNVYGEERRMYQ